MKHNYFCVVLISVVLQASSIAAVRAESSGSGDESSVNLTSTDTDTTGNQVESAPSEVTQSNSETVENKSYIVANSDEQKTDRAEIAYAQPRTDEALETSIRPERRLPSIAIIPMLGAGSFSGRWSTNINNDYAFGLLTEFPVTSLFSIEAEGGYSSYQIAYTNTVTPVGGYGHRFNQYMVGSNAKLYLLRTMIRPYIGAGLDAVYYQGMNHGPYDTNPYTRLTGYDQMIGAGQLLAGLDVGLGDTIAVGIRGSWLVPFINRPIAPDAVGTAGLGAAPGFEEAGAMNASFYRIQGTVRIAL